MALYRMMYRKTKRIPKGRMGVMMLPVLKIKTSRTSLPKHLQTAMARTTKIRTMKTRTTKTRTMKMRITKDRIRQIKRKKNRTRPTKIRMKRILPEKMAVCPKTD